ncbi:MAG TPA: Ig-like domain-containing protein [Casimicrobiaceae bacterium]|nr:Ig-like domain-containing protein [Casimicrobiaceae bacterium]
MWAALAASCVVDAATWTSDGTAVVRREGGAKSEIAIEADVLALAARSDGGAWLIAESALRSLASDGAVERAIDVADRGFGIPIQAAADPYDGSVWTTTDASLLLHFSRDGELRYGTSIANNVSNMVVDASGDVWWVAGAELIHLSRDENRLETRSLRVRADDINALAIDVLHDRIWIAAISGVYSMPLHDSSMPVTRILERETTALALDAVSGTALAIVDSTAIAIDDALHPVWLSVSEPALAVAYDAQERAFVVETESAFVRLVSDGRDVAHAEQTKLSGKVLRVAGERREELRGASPLRLAPMLALVRPPSGGAVSDPRTEIILRVGASCNGTACAAMPAYLRQMRVDAWVDDASLGEAFVAMDGAVSFPFRPFMTPGDKTLRANVTDMLRRTAVIEAHWTVLSDAVIATTPQEHYAQPGATKATNKAPTVALTSPANGMTFTAGSPITLAANASDPDGTISKVEFYRGASTLIGTATSAPYGYTWTNATSGTYSLTAKAYDDRRATTTSSAVSITVVDNKPPSIVLTSPSLGTFAAAGSTVTFSATATDVDGTVARVEFFDGAVSVGVVSRAPFQLAWIASSVGTHTISAIATDDRGGTARSQYVDILVGAAPTVVVTGPAFCSVIDGPVDVVVTADAKSTSGTISSVEFFDNGVSIGSSTLSPWRGVITRAATGLHSITAKAIDDQGQATTSRASTFTIRAQNQPPTVTLAAPTEGMHFKSGAAINIAATASDSDGIVAAVEFRLNSAAGTLIGRSTAAPFATTWTNAGAGSYTIVAVAYDDRNASSTSSPVHITVDPNAVPSVAIIAPASGSTFTAPANVTVSATASDTDGSIAKVDFFAGSTLIGSATAAPYAITWNASTEGAYSLTAKATDNLGGATTSLAVPITIAANALPTVTITSVTPSNQYFAPETILISADASDSDGTIAAVDFYANGSFIGHADTPPYRFAWDAVPAGTYAITAKATDNAGGVSTSGQANITVRGAPTIGFDGVHVPAAVNDDNIMIRGFVSAPANSAVTVNGVVTHIDDLGFFQLNDVFLVPGDNPITAILTTQDGQTATKTVTVNSTGPGAFVVTASPTEGLNSLQVTFTIENPANTAFKQILIDLDGDGLPNYIALPAQLLDGKLSLIATYPVGTYLATVKAYDDNNALIYSTTKSIVVRAPELLQLNLLAIYDGMMTHLRAGNIAGAMMAFTGSAYDKYNEIFTLLGPSLATIVDQVGQVQEITFNMDMAEITIVRNTPDGPVSFMLYMIRSEDGIWRIDGM